jgi:hypothetical protein
MGESLGSGPKWDRTCDGPAGHGLPAESNASARRTASPALELMSITNPSMTTDSLITPALPYFTTRYIPSSTRVLPLSSLDRSPCSFMSAFLVACHRPASDRPPSRLACLARFLLQVEEGGSSAKRWAPLPRKPRREAKPGPEAGRRHGRLLRRTPRNEHQEANTHRRTRERSLRRGCDSLCADICRSSFSQPT